VQKLDDEIKKILSLRCNTADIAKGYIERNEVLKAKISNLGENFDDYCQWDEKTNRSNSISRTQLLELANIIDTNASEEFLSPLIEEIMAELEREEVEQPEEIESLVEIRQRLKRSLDKTPVILNQDDLEEIADTRTNRIDRIKEETQILKNEYSDIKNELKNQVSQLILLVPELVDIFPEL
jgi:hypothetical protein